MAEKEKLEKQKKEDYLIIYPKGKLNLYASKGIETEIMELIDEENENKIILNFKDIEHVSSSGVKLLISVQRKLANNNGVFKMCLINSGIKRIFEVLEITNLFLIYDTEEEALKD